MKSNKNSAAASCPSQFLLNFVFLLALGLLLGNDHFWKFSYPGWWTGKISDFAGLVLLPLWLAFLFPAWRQSAVVYSAVFFLFWKSPLTTPLIDGYNLFSPIAISRVIDYTDYLALLVLPLPWYLIRKPALLEAVALPQFLRQPAGSFFLLLITSISFVATSPPHWYYLSGDAPGNVKFYQAPYKVKHSQAYILNRLREEGITFRQFIQQDTSRIFLARYDPDSLDNSPHNFFEIPELVVEGDTFNNINFVLINQGEEQTGFLLSSMNVPGHSEAQIIGSLNKRYRKMLKRELVRKVRK